MKQSSLFPHESPDTTTGSLVSDVSAPSSRASPCIRQSKHGEVQEKAGLQSSGEAGQAGHAEEVSTGSELAREEEKEAGEARADRIHGDEGADTSIARFAEIQLEIYERGKRSASDWWARKGRKWP